MYFVSKYFFYIIFSFNLRKGSPDYKDKIKEIIEKALISKKSFDIISYSYKTLENSPRIIPSLYDTTTNNAKKIVRDYGYSQSGQLAKELGYVLVDCDISM